MYFCRSGLLTNGVIQTKRRTSFPTNSSQTTRHIITLQSVQSFITRASASPHLVPKRVILNLTTIRISTFVVLSSTHKPLTMVLFGLFPQTADANHIFQYQFESDHTISVVILIYTTLWGSLNPVTKGTILNILTSSNLKLVNHQTPTRLDPRNKTLTSIDLTLTSHNIHNIKWRVDHHNYDPSMSDHFSVFINIPLQSHTTDNIYHSTWNLSSKTKWKKYQQTLSQGLDKFTPDINSNTHANQIKT